MFRYTLRDLVRNPRRTVVSLIGIALGVGLFCAVLFFIDGSGATITSRALAPLSLDMQRVMTAPLGENLALDETLSPSATLRPGEVAHVTLTVTNRGTATANDVVINDEPPAPLAYLAGTTRRGSRALPDEGGRSPLAQSLAGIGFAVGRVLPGASVSLTYDVRALRAVADAHALRLRGSLSSRDALVPIAANGPRRWTLEMLRRAIGRIPGVAAADALSFVDLPAGALVAGRNTVDGPVRVFAFTPRYQRRYPSIRITAGSFTPGSVLASAEAARALAVTPGDTVQLRLPGAPTRLALRIGGVTDLARATTLFSSRKASKFEDFLYVPDSIVVSPAVFERAIVPAYRTQSAALGTLAKSVPMSEVDVLVDRSRIHADPAAAFAQTRAIARAIGRVAPQQDYLIDNISNALHVARADAAVGKRMFLFLGLPAALLAALLAAYAGSVLASTQRRELATLRIRGAHRGHLLRMLAYRTLLLAGVGSAVGGVLGFAAALAILGGHAFLRAALGELALSALIGIGGGLFVTALALWATGRRSLAREIGAERRELALEPAPRWRRMQLDVVLLVGAAVGIAIALRSGAFAAPHGSVTLGQATSLPSHLILAPLVAWAGGILLCVRLLVAVASRLWIPAAPGFGPVGLGLIGRSLRRRAWSLGPGMATLGLVVAFCTSLAIFAASYDTAKAADSRFVVGSDLRVTPSVLDPRPPRAEFAAKLRVAGVSSVTPVVFKLENSVLIGPANQSRTNLAAIEARSFARTAALSDSFFAGRSAASALSALATDPQGILVGVQPAGDLSIQTGDRVRVLLALGTRHQTMRTFRVVGLITSFPGFPTHADLVVNLRFYQSATSVRRVDFFLARTLDNSNAGLAAAVSSLRSVSGRDHAIAIDSTATALAKDQSSLTALDVRGLLSVDLLFALPMAATVIAILVFSLILQRQREYVTLHAQGMQTRELLAVILAESAFVALGGLSAGGLVGTGAAYLLVHVLQPLFVLPPEVTIPVAAFTTLFVPTLVATLVFAVVATLRITHLHAPEILRDA